MGHHVRSHARLALCGNVAQPPAFVAPLVPVVTFIRCVVCLSTSITLGGARPASGLFLGAHTLDHRVDGGLQFTSMLVGCLHTLSCLIGLGKCQVFHPETVLYLFTADATYQPIPQCLLQVVSKFTAIC